jgi:hypothetical protein
MLFGLVSQNAFGTVFPNKSGSHDIAETMLKVTMINANNLAQIYFY